MNKQSMTKRRAKWNWERIIYTMLCIMAVVVVGTIIHHDRQAERIREEHVEFFQNPPEGVEWGVVEVNVYAGDTLTSIAKELRKEYPAMSAISIQTILDTASEMNIANEDIKAGQTIGMPVWFVQK